MQSFHTRLEAAGLLQPISIEVDGGGTFCKKPNHAETMFFKFDSATTERLVALQAEARAHFAEKLGQDHHQNCRVGGYHPHVTFAKIGHYDRAPPNHPSVFETLTRDVKASCIVDELQLCAMSKRSDSVAHYYLVESAISLK